MKIQFFGLIIICIFVTLSTIVFNHTNKRYYLKIFSRANANDFINYIYSRRSSPVLNIAMATDKQFVYPLQVSIISALLNSNHNVLNYHILVPRSLSSEDKAKIKELERRFENCKINFIVMGNEYDKFSTANGRLSSVAYFRLSLQTILPDIDRVLWLDCDVLVRKDLSQIFSFDMDDLYFLGFQDYHGYKVFGHPNDRYVCSGVLLMNLEKMREDDLEQKMKDFLALHDKDADKQDQTAINSVGYDGIRFLPPEYGIFNFPSKKEIDKYFNGNKYGNYTRQEIDEAIRDPTVLHMVKKPWKEIGVPFFKEWWKYAKTLGNPAYDVLKQTLLDNIKFSKHFFWWLLMKLRLIDL